MGTMTLAEIEANPIPVIEAHRDANPWLHWGGIGSSYDVDRIGPDAFAKRRQDMTSEYGVAQVLRAARFINQAPRTRTLNKRRSTYGWKHVAERHFQNLAHSRDYYIGEGSFLVAAWAMGLLVKADHDGTHWVNIAEAAATAAQAEVKRLREAGVPA